MCSWSLVMVFKLSGPSVLELVGPAQLSARASVNNPGNLPRASASMNVPRMTYVGENVTSGGGVIKSLLLATMTAE